MNMQMSEYEYLFIHLFLLFLLQVKAVSSALMDYSLEFTVFLFIYSF